MAWDEAQGNGGGDYEDRDLFKFANTKGENDGKELKGVFRRMSKEVEGKFSVGRFMDVDRDGAKLKVWASGILKERLEEAVDKGLKPGNPIWITHSVDTSKDGQNEYNNYRFRYDLETFVPNDSVTSEAPKDEPKLTQEQAASQGKFLNEPPF